ncbi:unnamed protein product [Leptosia nina]|uniref:Uncharacterized protein n=1 Tax=Leptosia nina TaxID=320188 RepID=A0AAV1JMU2_9NEOP
MYTTSASLDEDEESTESEEESEVEECTPSPSARPALAALPPQRPSPREDSLMLDSQYYSYSLALGVTVGAGCFLLALNLIVFAGIYLQRGKRRTNRRPRRDGKRISAFLLFNITFKKHLEPRSRSPGRCSHVASEKHAQAQQRLGVKRSTGERRGASKEARSDTGDFGVELEDY